MKENGLILKMVTTRRYSARTITYVDYVDDIALLVSPKPNPCCIVWSR